MRAPALLLLVCLWAAESGAAEPLIADLTTHYIPITTGFAGTNVVLFGATDGPGDIVVIVRGPPHDAVVRRKSRVAGIWMNTNQLTFSGVPSYYAVYSSRPLDEIAPPSMQALHEIGVGRLHFAAVERDRSPEEIAAFRAALIRERERDGLFFERPGPVKFLGDRLFQATMRFPADVPTGNYGVEILLLRDKAVVSGQTSPLFVSPEGLDAEVHDFADHWALLYGLIAVLGAAMAGWLASLPFRNA
jgi:uncharacterized protein (TIGR02186 family)